MIKYTVDDKAFQAAFKNAQRKIGDLTLPLMQIAGAWMRENKALSTYRPVAGKTARSGNLVGQGQYTDLKESTKKYKRRRWGQEYPILFASGKLLGSVQIQSPDTITQVINKNSLLIGTQVPYAKYHQYGTKNLPVRPMVLISAQGNLERTLFRWTSIINAYVSGSLEQAGLK